MPPPSDFPWTHGLGPAGDEPVRWTREADDPPPTSAEHRDFCDAAGAAVQAFLAARDLAGDDPPIRVRGDFSGDRTEELVVDPVGFAERPQDVAALVRVAQEFLTQARWRRWRLVVPLRDAQEGGLLTVYPDAVFARRALAPEELERHVHRLVLREVAQREGEETVRRSRREKLTPLVRSALLPFLASGAWARVLATEPGEPGYELVWILHRFAAGMSEGDLDLDPESGYQEVLPLGDDGDFDEAFGEPDRERLRVVLWEVPTDRGRVLRITAGQRDVRLAF